jgi:ABC-type bacteriocin/lantibiotic exporter with double-glycine peptidase domain
MRNYRLVLSGSFHVSSRWPVVMVVVTVMCCVSSLVFAVEENQPPLRCGSQCLYTALKVFEVGPKTFDALEQQIGQPGHQGYTLAEIQDAAQKCGLETQAVSTTLENLLARRRPFCCIAHVNGNHFVLLGNCDSDDVQIVDPPRSFTIPKVTFLAQWSGTALLLSDRELESEALLVQRLWRKKILWRLVYLSFVLIVVASGIRFWKAWRR